MTVKLSLLILKQSTSGCLEQAAKGEFCLCQVWCTRALPKTF